jgi:hypothetical protein
MGRKLFHSKSFSAFSLGKVCHLQFSIFLGKLNSRNNRDNAAITEISKTAVRQLNGGFNLQHVQKLKIN